MASSNVERGYIDRSDQFESVPGIFDLTRFWTNELRRPIVVVTNQCRIGVRLLRRKGLCGLDAMDVQSI